MVKLKLCYFRMSPSNIILILAPINPHLKKGRSSVLDVVVLFMAVYTWLMSMKLEPLTVS